VEGASDMFAGTVLDLLYSAAFNVYPGFVFLVIAGMYCIALICSM
jgi:hypothetical protein